jgi:hypothetical protein
MKTGWQAENTLRGQSRSPKLHDSAQFHTNYENTPIASLPMACIDHWSIDIPGARPKCD